ncbi:hypothetical protein LTR84_004090 [Exophiala bonariae]|uniref:ER-bound oxygenase mpaB/mpaB'/Rubber oxygenase catalytic domain-containing protein n=1 Tax=Exophiala bonariae TaxID=1690606 RepID=A0AAV9N8S0_9EURO|nr:hypothetical protein LTR84_004090 [Exophiala bonariae]
MPLFASTQRKGDLKDAWGYQFRWTENHQTAEQYNHLKYSCDTLAEECSIILNGWPSSEEKYRSYGKQEVALGESPSKPDEKKSASPSNPPKRDLYRLFQDHHKEDAKLQQLWDEVNTIPQWVDWDQIGRGQDVLYRYGGATFTGLTYQSLVGGTAGSRVAEVLSRTGGFAIHTVLRRLLETTLYILECTDNVESIKPGGKGFASCLRVRFLHATVRQRILQLTSKHPSYYSVEKNGVPVNDLDCIGTIAGFSSTIIWQSLPRQGIYLRQQEIEDYIALWRLVAHYMGTPTEHFSTPAKARAIMESIFLYEYKPSPTSQTHAQNIILALENTPPAHASRPYLEASARWLNGNRLSNALGLGRPGLYYSFLTVCQCLMFMTVYYTCRAIPLLDRAQIKASRSAVWAALKTSEYDLDSRFAFDLKYLPKLEGQRKTEYMSPSERRQADVFWTADRKSLFILAILGLASVVGPWLSWKVVYWASRMTSPAIFFLNGN